MPRFSVGDKVAAPVCIIFPEKTGTRSRYGYDIGVVVATGKNKKTGKPAIKVSIPVSDSVWAKKITEDSELQRWCLASDCDKV